MEKEKYFMDEVYEQLKTSAEFVGEEEDNMICVTDSIEQAMKMFRGLMCSTVGHHEAEELEVKDISFTYLHPCHATPGHPAQKPLFNPEDTSTIDHECDGEGCEMWYTDNLPSSYKVMIITTGI